MGFLLNFLNGNAPTQNALQQEGNQIMLKMLQDRLAASTCPTERVNLQNNINNIQRALQQNQMPPQINPIPAPQNPTINIKPSVQALEQEINNLKGSLARIDSILVNLKSQT